MLNAVAPTDPVGATAFSVPVAVPRAVSKGTPETLNSLEEQPTGTITTSSPRPATSAATANPLAQDKANTLYRRYGTGKGSFAARVKIGSGWQGYRGLFWPTRRLDRCMSIPRRGNRWGHDR
jgi:hypothetical protein